MTAPRKTVVISVRLPPDELEQLDAAAREQGVQRNRFIRDWILSLRRRKA